MRNPIAIQLVAETEAANQIDDTAARNAAMTWIRFRSREAVYDRHGSFRKITWASIRRACDAMVDIQNTARSDE